MKKIFSLILILVLVLGVVPVYGASVEPEIDAQAAVLIDATTGKVLYEKNAQTKEDPGAATIMLTALLSLENLNTTDYTTTTADELTGLGRSGLALRPEEDINIGTLISATMTVAAQDGAAVLSNRVSGSAEEFAALMNERVSTLGLLGTHFVNGTGVADENQYSTAYDLAMIARHCMQNEVFARVCSRATFTVPITNISIERNLSNNNLLLYDESSSGRVYVNNTLRHCKYDGCTGIIAGYSEASGGVVVSAATSQNTSLIAVVLNSGEKTCFSDSIQLLDYGFNNYKTVRIGDAGLDTGAAAVAGGKTKTVGTIVNSVLNATISVDSSASQVTTNVVFDENLTAPLEAGAKAGTLQLICDNQIVAEYDIVTTQAVEKGGLFNNFHFGIIGKILLVLLIILLIIVLLFAAFLLNEKRKSEKRKKAREKRRAEAAAQEEALRREWEETYRKKNDLN